MNENFEESKITHQRVNIIRYMVINYAKSDCLT